MKTITGYAARLEREEIKHGSRRIKEAAIMAKRTMHDIFYWIEALEAPQHEVPYFDHDEWSVCTRHVVVWKIWPDERNQNPDLFEEALKATDEIIKTGRPLFGGIK